MSVIHEQEEKRKKEKKKKKRDLIYYVAAVVHIAHIQWKNTCPKKFRIHGLKEEWQIYSTKSRRKQVTWELQ